MFQFEVEQFPPYNILNLEQQCNMPIDLLLPGDLKCFFFFLNNIAERKKLGNR